MVEDKLAARLAANWQSSKGERRCRVKLMFLEGRKKRDEKQEKEEGTKEDKKGSLLW